MRSFGVTAPLPPRTDAGMIHGTASSEAAALRLRKARRLKLETPELGTWMGVGREIAWALSLSLSPSKGERVPFRAGEGPPATHPVSTIRVVWGLGVNVAAFLITRGPPARG